MADKALKTSVFVWEGTDKKGTKVKGELSSQNPTLVKAQLRKQGITPVKVRKKGISLLGAGKKIKPMDIALFTRQMSTMMAAGVPLLQSFDIISEGFDNPNMRKLVEEIKQEVAGGNSLANSLRKKPQYFDSLYCNLVDAGEQSGALETLLDRVATYKEKTEALKAKIKKAMTYPIAVIVVAIIVSAILLIKVVPQFQSVFEGFGAELPAFTQMVINISNVLQEWWLLVLLMMGGAGFLLNHAYKRSEKFRDATDPHGTEAAYRRRHPLQIRRGTLRADAVDHLRRRRAIGGSPRLGFRRHRQRGVQGRGGQDQAGRVHRHAAELLHAHHQHLPQHGHPDDRHRRGVGRAGRHAGQGRWLLRAGSG